MVVKCCEIIEALEKRIPLHLAEKWDKVGLMVAEPDRLVRKILVCLDVTDAVVEQAKTEQVDLIISHHPLIFQPLEQLNWKHPLERRVIECVRQGFTVWSAHTNWDIVTGGVNDTLAKLLGIKNSKILQVTNVEKLLKLVVFVPKTHEEAVRLAITNAGAGSIGQYRDCTFRVPGCGTFTPQTGTNPFIGEIGKTEEVSEVRIETILPEKIKNNVLRAMISAHPYEEVAFDLYPLEIPGQVEGIGRIGQIEPCTLENWISYVKAQLRVKHLRYVGNLESRIDTVAICGGSGSFLIKEAAKKGAHVLVTGDLKYHEAQEALDAGLSVIDAGHFATEWPSVAALAAEVRLLAQQHHWSVQVQEDQKSIDPFQFV